MRNLFLGSLLTICGCGANEVRNVQETTPLILQRNSESEQLYDLLRPYNDLDIFKHNLVYDRWEGTRRIFGGCQWDGEIPDEHFAEVVEELNEISERHSKGFNGGNQTITPYLRHLVERKIISEKDLESHLNINCEVVCTSVTYYKNYFCVKVLANCESN